MKNRESYKMTKEVLEFNKKMILKLYDRGLMTGDMFKIFMADCNSLYRDIDLSCIALNDAIIKYLRQVRKLYKNECSCSPKRFYKLEEPIRNEYLKAKDIALWFE